jgi:hypothetical protein
MAASVVAEYMCVVTNLECSKVNGSSPCLCCVKLKAELQRVVSELKSVVEIKKGLKEDQEQLSRSVDSIECRSVNILNTVCKAGSNAVCLIDWKTVSQHKIHAKINKNPHQFKIPGVVNSFAVLDNLKEDNSVPQCQNFKVKPMIKKLKSTNFPTRITNSSATTIDSFFIRKCRSETYSIYSLSNGLLNHDAQILTLNNVKCMNSHNYVIYRRDINEFTKSEFMLHLNCELWVDVFTIEDDVNLMFNNFLNAY